jgi:hypothetical protein
MTRVHSSRTFLGALGALAVLLPSAEAHAAWPSLSLGSMVGDGWSGLHVTEMVESVAGSVRGCLSQGVFGAFWGGVDPAMPGAACAGSGSLLLDVAFLALLVVGVIAVVRIRQRSEQSRLELARQYIEKGMEPPATLFPSAAGNDLRRGIVLVFTGLGLLGASLVASGWSHGVQGLGPAGLIPGFIGLGYLVSYACAVRGTPQ